MHRERERERGGRSCCQETTEDTNDRCWSKVKISQSIITLSGFVLHTIWYFKKYAFGKFDFQAFRLQNLLILSWDVLKLIHPYPAMYPNLLMLVLWCVQTYSSLSCDVSKITYPWPAMYTNLHILVLRCVQTNSFLSCDVCKLTHFCPVMCPNLPHPCHAMYPNLLIRILQYVQTYSSLSCEAAMYPNQLILILWCGGRNGGMETNI